MSTDLRRIRSLLSEKCRCAADHHAYSGRAQSAMPHPIRLGIRTICDALEGHRTSGRHYTNSQPGKELTTVTTKLNEPLEVALRRFRRSIENTGLIKELRARMAYETPTAKRKRKKAAAVSRLRKQIKRSLPPRKQY